MATKRCLYISTFGPKNAPQNNAAEAIFNVLVAPVFRIDFPDFEIVRYNSEIIHGQIDAQILEDIQTADLVVADLTELTQNGFYELGVRHATGLPTVLLAQTGHAIPFDMKDFRFVIYSYKATDDELEQRTREALIESVRSALQSPSTPGAGLPANKATPSETRHELVARIQESADALQSLRINSAAEIVASLHKIATDLEAVQDDKTPSAMKEAGEKVLKILSRIADQLATVRGSRIIVAGIISLVIGGAGYPAFTVYGLTLAFWQGPEIFSKAIEAMAKRKK
jgi:RNA polymerase-interacting CarD/CdnL/TRCF family regulator